MRKRLTYSKHLIYIKQRHAVSSTQGGYKTELQQADSILAALTYLNYAL